MNKPKPIKNFKIALNGKIYDKIIYFNCDSESAYFENMDNETTSTNVRCKPQDIEIIINNNKDTK